MLPAKSNTLRPAASAKTEETSHPKTAKKADTWAKVVGRKGKKAARKKAKQEAKGASARAATAEVAVHAKRETQGSEPISQAP